MAAELVTPTDELSGIPYPIIPSAEGLPRNPARINAHHTNHPAAELHAPSDPTVDPTAALAWRNARIQLTDERWHNYGPRAYHRYFKGPLLPKDTDDIFSRCMLATAAYIPEYGIDVHGSSPVVRRILPWEMAWLREPAGLGLRHIYYGYDPIRTFVQEHALRQNVRHLPDGWLHAFLDELVPREKRHYLGHLILSQAARVAAEGVNQKYALARRAGLLHPQAPAAAHALIKYKMGSSERRAKLFPQLAAQIAVQLG